MELQETLIENEEIPLRRLGYATSGVFMKGGFLFPGEAEYVKQITEKMDKKREFNASDIILPPELSEEARNLILKNLSVKAKIIKDLGDERYRAKRKVYVEWAWFANP